MSYISSSSVQLMDPDDERLKRANVEFEREINAMVKLSHPHVIGIIGQTRKGALIIMQSLEALGSTYFSFLFCM